MTEAAVAAPVTPPAPELPRYRDIPRQRGRLVLTILFALLAVAGVGVLVYAIVRVDEPVAFSFAITYALIPLPLLWFCYWWLDRYEPEPRRYKLAAFAWGSVGAVAIAFVLNTFFADVVEVRSQEVATVVAPIVEESAKGVFLLLTFLRWRRVLDGFLDGVILAGIVGLGFAFSENILYYTTSYLGAPGIRIDGADAATITFVVRGVFSPFAHPLFTAALGVGLGLAVATRSWPLKVLFTAGGLLVSMLLHATWNGSVSYLGGLAFLPAYLLLATLFFTLAVFAIIQRVRQVRVLDSSLGYIAERGWIHPAEIPYLSRFAYRRRARKYAKENGGKTALAAVKRYQRLATEVSFLHHGIMEGRRLPHGIDRTYALLDAMHDVRPYVLLPPPLPPAPAPAWVA